MINDRWLIGCLVTYSAARCSHVKAVNPALGRFATRRGTSIIPWLSFHLPSLT
jgi:hypothetical protein